MDKKVLVCVHGGVHIVDDPKTVDAMEKWGGEMIVLDISKCSMWEVAEMSARYGREFAWGYKIGKTDSNLAMDYADYIVDTNDEDWWEDQVGR